MDLLPKYNQRKGRPMSRAKSLLARQLQTAGNRPLQPKLMLISSQNENLNKLVLPQRPVLLQNHVTHNGNGSNIPAAAFIPSQITVTVQQPQVSSRPFLEIGRPTVLIEESSNDAIPQISIPSPAPYLPSVTDAEQNDERDEDVAENGHHNDSFSLSLFDENSRSDLDGSSRAATSTPTHLKVDHFLDSVLENSNSSLLQTPRRHSPPPSPPGGMNEHSWLPELSLSSFLGSLPNDGGVGVGAHDSHSKMVMMSHHADSIQSTGSEVDRQLTLMLTENSLDFTARFARLTSALNSTD